MLVSWLEPIEDKRVLDLACGAGNYSRMFCRLGASEVTGVDSSQAMIASAISLTPEIMPVSYQNLAAEDYASAIPYDLVFHAYLFKHGKCKSYTLAFWGILCSRSFPELAENLMFQVSFGLVTAISEIRTGL